MSVQSGLRGRNDLRVGRKMATFNCFFSRVGLRAYQHPCTGGSTCPSSTISIRNPAFTDLRSSPGFSGEKPATTGWAKCLWWVGANNCGISRTGTWPLYSCIPVTERFGQAVQQLHRLWPWRVFRFFYVVTIVRLVLCFVDRASLYNLLDKSN